MAGPLGSLARGLRASGDLRRGACSPLFLAALLAAAAVVASGIAVYVNLQTAVKKVSFVAHTLEVQAELTEVLSLLKDVETGQHGYLLTDRIEYLEPYGTATAHLPDRLDRLEALTAADPAQHERAGELRRLAQAKLAVVGESLRLREAGDAAGAIDVIRTGVGKRVMDEARAVAASMRSEEDRRFTDRGRFVEAAIHRTAAFVAASTGLVLVFVLAVFYTGRTSARRLQQLASELEVRVAKRTRELSEANADLEEFSYTIAHDLRAPVRNMHSLAEALAEDFAEELPAEGTEYTKRIVAAADRMDALIQDLLGYARLSREAIQPQPVDLDAAVGVVLAQMKPDIEERRAEITVDRPLGRVRAHRTTLEQAITNLIGNALKFVERGKAPVVHVRAEERGDRVRLWVEDRGIGVAPEHAERIFRVFERLHAPEAYPGTGVGLAIVRKGTERMGGTSGVESEPGRGSRFWIELPRLEAA